MIKTLRAVKCADRHFQKMIDAVFHSFRIIIQNSSHQQTQILFLNPFFKPFTDLIFINTPYFHIGNCQTSNNNVSIQSFRNFFQITGKEQKVPSIVCRFTDFLIRDILMNRLLNRYVINKSVQIFFHGRICSGYQFPNNLI